MEWDEERDRRFCLQMPNMLASEGRTSESRGEDTITPYSSMEMGEDNYGFCDRSSTDSKAARYYMGDVTPRNLSRSKLGKNNNDKNFYRHTL